MALAAEGIAVRKASVNRMRTWSMTGVDRLWPTPARSSWGADTIIIPPDIFFSARPIDVGLTSAMERARAVLDQRSIMSYGTYGIHATYTTCRLQHTACTVLVAYGDPKPERRVNKPKRLLVSSCTRPYCHRQVCAERNRDC
jgi:hypothetical protein